MDDRIRAALGISLIIVSGVFWVLTGASVPTYSLDFSQGDANQLPPNIDERHVTTLDTADSFSTSSTITNRGYALNHQYAINRSTEIAYHKQDIDGATTEWYTVENATTKYSESGSEDSDEIVNETEATGIANILTTGIQYRFKGNETYDGQKVERYTGVKVLDNQVFSNAFHAPVPDGTEIADFSATLLVDAETGVVRHHEWSVTLEIGERTVPLSGQVSVTDIGSTTVQPPEE